MKILIQILVLSLFSLSSEALAQEFDGKFLCRYYGGKVELEISGTEFSGCVSINGKVDTISGYLSFDGENWIITDAKHQFMKGLSITTVDKCDLLLGKDRFYRLTLMRRVFKRKIPIKYPDF